MEGKD